MLSLLAFLNTAKLAMLCSNTIFNLIDLFFKKAKVKCMQGVLYGKACLYLSYLLFCLHQKEIIYKFIFWLNHTVDGIFGS